LIAAAAAQKCCCPKQGSNVLFPGALPLASAGVGGYIYIYLVNMDVNGVYDQLITWGEYFTDVESFNPIDLAMNQYI
jgi:hypothetical protein